MTVIKPKIKTVIKKGEGYSYNKDTFDQEKFDYIYEAKSAQEMIDLFGDRDWIALDTETTCFRDLESKDIPEGIVRRWVGSGKKATPQDVPFAISMSDGKVAVTLYDDIDNGYAEFKKLKPILENNKIAKVLHNAKFDMHELANIGIHVKGKIHDTVVLTKLVDENRKSFKLMDVVNKERGIVKFEYMVDNYKKTYKVSDYAMINRDLMTQYAGADVINCAVVFEEELPLLEAQGLLPLYENESQLMLALYEMERHGMKINIDYEKPLKEELQKVCDAAEQSIYDDAGRMFNINSGAQIHKALIDMGVSTTLFKMTEKGNVKMDKKELERLGQQAGIELVNKILEYRQCEKLLTTYAVGIYGQADSVDKVHGSINQTEATTGRMSITKPALQTLPKKDKRIRKAFIPSDGYKLVFMDLDQVEYRLYAHYAKDEQLCQLIRDGYDVHTATAALIFSKPAAEVTEEERSMAKTINFGLIYGMGAEGLAIALKMNRQDAYEFRQRYFAALPSAQPFIKQVEGVIHARGFVKNFYGRRRRLKASECYKACNALIQGCAADYIKHKLVRLYKYIKKNKLDTRMINIVHDEIVFEVPEHEMHLLPMMRSILSDFKTFRAPITAGVEIGGPSWGEKYEPEDVGFEDITDEFLKELDDFNLYEEVI